MFLLGDSQTQQTKRNNLTRKGFGGSHADFRTHMEIGAAVGGAGDTGTDDIAHSVKESALLLCQLDGGQRVGGFTALAHGNDHIIGIDDGVAVPEFRGVFHLNGNLRRLLYEILANEGRVPGSAARANDDTTGVHKLVLVVNDAAEHHILGFRVQSPFDAGAQSVGLFPNLLEHEVRESALFQLIQRQAQGVHLGGLVHIGEVYDVDLTVAVQTGNLLVFQVNHLVGVFDYGRGIAAQIELFPALFVGAHSDNKR